MQRFFDSRYSYEYPKIMDRKTIRTTIEKQYGNFLSVTQVAELLGCSRETARRDYLDGLDFIKVGNAKKYFKDDLADAIMKRARQ